MRPFSSVRPPPAIVREPLSTKNECHSNINSRNAADGIQYVRAYLAHGGSS
jgi:hypothetical protein